MTKPFDLSKYETVDTAVLTVQDPKGDDLIGENGEPVTITLYGMGSKQYVNAKYKLDNASQTRSIALLRNGKAAKAEEITKDQAVFFAAVTASISNFPVEPLELYSNPKLAWITSQVDKFLGETENFMPS
jgi:hypothetical protein